MNISNSDRMRDSKKIYIRSAVIDDANTLLKEERAIAEMPGYFCSSPSELSLVSIINAISAFKDGNGIFLVAECSGELVGHAFLDIPHIKSLQHVAELNMAVHLGWQNQGIGKLLLERIIDWAKDSKSIRKIQLNVRATNSPALHLYKKMGFEEEGRLKNRVRVKDEYVDDIVMGLSLV